MSLLVEEPQLKLARFYNPAIMVDGRTYETRERMLLQGRVNMPFIMILAKALRLLRQAPMP